VVDETAVADEHNTVGPAGERRIVSDHDGGHAPFAGSKDKPHDGFADGRVEGAGRLVGQEQPALTDHGSCDSDTLPFATGELIGEVCGTIGQAENLQRLKALPTRLTAADAIQFEG
jgi:hypothetical protein